MPAAVWAAESRSSFSPPPPLGEVLLLQLQSGAQVREFSNITSHDLRPALPSVFSAPRARLFAEESFVAPARVSAAQQMNVSLDYLATQMKAGETSEQLERWNEKGQ